MAKKPLTKKVKRLFRQVKEGAGWYAAEQKRKAAAAKKKKKKDWADKYQIGTRDVINKLRDSGISDKDIKTLLDRP